MNRTQEIRRAFDYHHCDKGSRHGYESIYASLDPARVRRLLEVGVYQGASVASWIDLFPAAKLFALDTFQRQAPETIPILFHPRVAFYAGDSRAINLHHLLQFDTIIDDGSHAPRDQAATFRNLWPHLSPRGHYFIEDVWCFEELRRPGPWLKARAGDFNDEAYRELLDTITETGAGVVYHDNRSGHQPDSYILEVVKQ